MRATTKLPTGHRRWRAMPMPSRRGVLKNMYVNAVEGRDRNDYPAIPSPNPWLEARVRVIPPCIRVRRVGHIKKMEIFKIMMRCTANALTVKQLSGKRVRADTGLRQSICPPTINARQRTLNLHQNCKVGKANSTFGGASGSRRAIVSRFLYTTSRPASKFCCLVWQGRDILMMRSRYMRCRRYERVEQSL